MHQKLQRALELLLLNVEVLNEEIFRLTKSEQFSATQNSFQLIERIRGECTSSLQTLQTLERTIYKIKKKEKSSPPQVIGIK